MPTVTGLTLERRGLFPGGPKALREYSGGRAVSKWRDTAAAGTRRLEIRKEIAMRRRHMLVGAFAALIAPARFGSAGTEKTFDPALFRAAQEAGQSLVVQVHATW
jgi:hypothetical protein